MKKKKLKPRNNKKMKINPKNWYQPRRRASKAHPFILDLMVRSYTTDSFTKIYGAQPIEYINILEGDWVNPNIRIKNLKNFGQSILKKTHKNPHFTQSLLFKSKGAAQRMVKDLDNLKKARLARLSDKRIYKLYFKFVNYYRRFSLFSFPLGLFGEKTLSLETQKILKKRKISRKEFAKSLTILIAPTIPSFIFKEELEILKLAYNFKKLKKSLLLQKLKNLVSKFGFIIYDYRGPKTKKRKDYLKEIKKNSKKINLEEEVKEKKIFYKRLKKRQENLIRNLKLTQKEKSIIHALQDAAVLQDMRKYYNSYFNFKTEILIKEMAKRLKIPFQLIRYILPHEMKKIWRNKKVDKKILEERTKLCVFNIKKGESKVYLGREMKPFLVLKEEYFEKRNIIKGVVASVGKVSGKIRIIKSKEQVKNLKKDEILVTPMTMPDFTPAIKKCVAIITAGGRVS